MEFSFATQRPHVLVAAATQGIGAATAEAFLKLGARVSFCSRNPAAVETCLTKWGALYPKSVWGGIADVSIADDLRRWVTQAREVHGPIHHVVTNTGGPPAGRPFEVSETQWDQGIQSTLLNVVRTVDLVREDLSKTPGSTIVHVTSVVAREPAPMLTISSTLRAGLIALTQLQARELGHLGIRVNAVLPGHTLTGRQTHLVELESQRQGITTEAVLKQRAESIPLKRLAKPEEIASAIVFLSSSGASYITGQSLLVDGGVARGL